MPDSSAAAALPLPTPPAPDAVIASPNWHRSFGTLVDMLEKPSFWTVLMRYLGDAVAFDNWVVMIFHREGKPELCSEIPVGGSGDLQLFQNYLESFYLLDPFYLACCEEPRAGLFRIDDVAPDNFEAEDYYQRYFRLNLVKDELQFNLPLDGGRVLSLSMGAARRFTADDMCVLSAITPWVLALMRQRQRFDERGVLPGEARPAEAQAAPEREASAAAGAMPLGLTAREVQIVHLMLSGHSSKGIAQKLQISPETVKAHRRNIYTKMGVRSHPELFSMLIQAGALPVRQVQD